MLDLLNGQRRLAGRAELLGELVKVSVGALSRCVQLLGLLDVRGPARLLDLLNGQRCYSRICS